MVPDLIIQVAVIALLLVLTVAVVNRMVKNYRIMKSDYMAAMRDNDDSQPIGKEVESDAEPSKDTTGEADRISSDG